MSTLKADSIQPTNNGNNLIFKTGVGDAERMRIDTSGNVGIGTNAPSNKLHIVANSQNTPPLFIYSGYGGDDQSDGGCMGLRIRAGDGSGTATLFDVQDSTSTTTHFVVKKNSVGIGTSTPAVALDVNGEARSSTSTTGSSNAKTLVTKDYTDNRLAFAWVVFRDPATVNPGGAYGSSTNCTIISGKNVSSVVRKIGGLPASTGSAWYELTFTEPCVDANYCATGTFTRRYGAAATTDSGWPQYLWSIPPYDAANGYTYYQQPSESGEAIPSGAISAVAGSLIAPSTKQVFRFHVHLAHAEARPPTIDVCRIGMLAIYR